MWEEYNFVDGHYFTPSGRSSRWRRIKLTEVDWLRDKTKNYDVHITVQRYISPTPQDGEKHICPLFIDLDSEKITDCQKDAESIISFFKQKLNAPKEAIRVWFSGSKGFHIFINEAVFGYEPHPELTYIHKLAAYWLEKYLNLKTIDFQAYSIRRMIRLPDSIHPKSHLYKIELYHEEILSDIEEIKKLAKQPRGELYRREDLEDIGVEKVAKDWYSQFIEQYEEGIRIQKLAPSKPIQKKDDEIPVCVEDLLKNGLRKKDTRCKAVLTLACFFKDIGKSSSETEEILNEFVAKLTPEFCDHAGNIRFLSSYVRSTVKEVFSKDKYHFVCNFIRALGTDEKPISCLYDECSFTDPESQEPEHPVKVHLSEASRVEYLDKMLAMGVVVSGKWDSPFAVPRRVRVTCKPNTKQGNSKCGACRMLRHGGKFEKQFSARTPEVLELIDVNTAMQQKALREICGIPAGCRSAKIEVLDYINIEEVQLIPEIENIMVDREYVRRLAFHLGHGMKTNQVYTIRGYSFPDPRNQYVVHVFSEYDSTYDSLTEFRMTKELQRELSIFQVKEGETVEEKFADILTDLEHNVTRVWGRYAMMIAIDLVYHSVCSFKLGRFNVRKGWVEALILGDSGQGKTLTSQRLIEHYDLGYRISGESAGRTGLVYNITETNRKWLLTWGAIPLNDRRLVVIDEFAEVPPEEVAVMSDLRSDGVAEVTKVIHTKTNARTRLLFITNAKDGYPLSTFSYPVTALQGIIPKAEDIRRLDFAVGVMSGDVDVSIINRRDEDIEEVEHKYTSFLCKNLILWAWSRKPEQVIFEKEAIDLILYYAKKMSDVYSTLIPLVEPADQRLKLARLSAACAARVFSTDDGESLIVKKEHVEFVYKYLADIYSSPALAYYQFSLKNKVVIVDEDEFKLLKAEFESFSKSETLASMLLDYEIFQKTKFLDAIDYEKEELTKVIAFLCQNKLAKPISVGFRLTASGIDFLKRFLREKGEKA